MRIAIISGEIPSTTFINSLINGMSARGYKMIVIGKKTGAYTYHQSVEIIEIPQSIAGKLFFILCNTINRGFANIKAIYKNSKSVNSFYYDLLFYLPILKAKPDKVHIQWASTLYQRELLFDLFKGKILLSLRGSHINYTPIIKPEVAETYTRLFPKVHKFHAVCEAIASEAEKYGAETGKIQTIYTSVENEIFKKQIIMKSKQPQFIIIAVGRFHWVKGYNYLIDALDIVKKNKIDFKLTLIAGNIIPQETLYSIHQYELSNNIEILDNLPYHEVLKKIEDADLMVLPSVNEGIANVVIEAMALGTPVISSDCGGMNEVIENEINGFLFENRNANDLADKILSFHHLNAERRNEFSIKAKAKVVAKFARNRMLDEFENFYA